MTPLKWNLAFFTALIVFALAITPLLYADGFSGGFDSFGSGGFDSFGSGGFDSFGSGGFDSFGSGGFDSFDTGSFGSGSDSTSTAGSQGSSESRFNSFDNNFQPFDNIPGNPAGPDYFSSGDDGSFPPSTPPGGSTPPFTPPTGGNGHPPNGQRAVLGIFIDNILLDDPFGQAAGETVPLRITFENDGNKDLDDTRVIVVIPDLAVYAAVGPIDLDVGKTVTKTLLLELPDDADLGEYPLMLQIQPGVPDANDRVVYREIGIIDY